MAEHDWLVVTGAASGIMEAGHVGAGREHSMGLNILLPFEQSANPIIAGDPKLVHMKYFFTRKLMFVKESDALCLLPGGFGTLDEGLEVLTLLQTGKRDMMPVVLARRAGRRLLDGLPASSSSSELLGRRHDRRRRPVALPADRPGRRGGGRDPAASSACTTACATSTSNWCSGSTSRWARSCSRRSTTISPTFWSSGRFVHGGPLPEEHDEPDLAALPRLIFHFNRRSFGRLRQLIDFINRAEGGRMKDEG